MTNKLAEITKKLTEIQGCQFVSFTYLSKKAGELARHTLNVGFNYHTAVIKSVTELEILMAENANVWTELQKTAATNVMASLKKTLEAHANGEQNADYTKKGQYIPIGNGVNVNTTDNTIQVFGLKHTKTVFTPGVYPKVNSRPLTIAQNEIRDQLTVGLFREFAMDIGAIAQVKANGNTIELEPVSV